MTPAPSDHFNGKTFFNPGGPAVRGLGDVLRWKLTSRPARWPDSIEVAVRPPPPAPAGDGVAAAWIGHSTFLLRSAGASILTDPIFSRRAGPTSWLGAARALPPAIAPDALPRIDAVLLSHDHYDHCDLPSLRSLARRHGMPVVAPLGHGPLLRDAGVGKVIELDWWEACSPAAGVRVTLVPARHWTRRRPLGTNRRLWGGFVAEMGGRRVYFVGDSGYDEALFAEIGRRFPGPDLALIPIGAYEPRWFMAAAHMNPAEAVLVHRAVRSRRSVAMHWGTFQLTDEAREEPVRALAEALGPDRTFTAVEPGGSVLA